MSSLSHSVWRPILACAGALGIGLALAPLALQPARVSQSLPSHTQVELRLLPAEVGVTQPVRATPFELVAGQISLRSGTPVATSSRGAVARQVASVGQKVKKGDPIVEISVGAAVHTAPAVEKKQNAAEKAQVAAADDQSALAQKVGDAHFRLAATQTRINAAQLRIKETRDIIARLRRGEHISLDGNEATTAPGTREDLLSGLSKNLPVTDTPNVPKAPAVVPRARRNRRRRHSPATDTSFQAAAQAQEQARSAAKSLSAARLRLKSAESNALQANASLKLAADRVDKVESQFADQLVAGSAVEEARSAARDAQADATDAANKAFAARQDVKNWELKASGLQAAAGSAETRASQTLKGARLFADDTTALPAPTATTSRSQPSHDVLHDVTHDMTLGQAVAMARAALQESKDASEQADAIHAEIDTYERQVALSKKRIDDTSKKLEQAQQQVMDSVPRPKFVPVLAPFDGTVTWLAPLAQEVAPGQKVFGLSPTSNFGVEFQVSHQQAAHLPPGSVLTATFKNSKIGDSAPVSASRESANFDAIASVRVETTSSPPGGKSRVKGALEILVPGTPPVVPYNNMPVTVSIPDAQAGECVVPESAVVESAGSSWLAVLTPGTDAAKRRFNIAWITVHKGFPQPGRGLSVSGVPVGTRYVRVANSIRAQLTPGENPSEPVIASVGDGG